MVADTILTITTILSAILMSSIVEQLHRPPNLSPKISYVTAPAHRVEPNTRFHVAGITPNRLLSSVSIGCLVTARSTSLASRFNTIRSMTAAGKPSLSSPSALTGWLNVCYYALLSSHGPFPGNPVCILLTGVLLKSRSSSVKLS